MQNTTSSRQWRTGWNGASRPTPSSLPSTKTTLLGPTWPGRGHFAHTQVSPSTRAAGALMMRRTLSVSRRRNKERDEYETESYRFDRTHVCPHIRGQRASDTRQFASAGQFSRHRYVPAVGWGCAGSIGQRAGRSWLLRADEGCAGKVQVIRTKLA